jgi:hypothetical protein
MSRVADENHLVSVASVTRDFQMNLGHQRTRCVKDSQTAPLGFVANSLRNAMGAEDQGCVVRHLDQLFDESRALRAEIFDHERVVYYFMAHVDGRAENLKGALYDLDRPVDPRTKPARVGK